GGRVVDVELALVAFDLHLTLHAVVHDLGVDVGVEAGRGLVEGDQHRLVVGRVSAIVVAGSVPVEAELVAGGALVAGGRVAHRANVLEDDADLLELGVEIPTEAGGEHGHAVELEHQTGGSLPRVGTRAPTVLARVRPRVGARTGRHRARC